MRYMHELKHTEEHLKHVQFYNSALWKRIEANNGQPPPAAAAAAAAPAPSAAAAGASATAGAGGAGGTAEWVEKPHPSWTIGDDVLIEKPYKGKYQKFVYFRGLIRMIVFRGNECLIFVRLTHDKDGKQLDYKIDHELMRTNSMAFGYLGVLRDQISNCVPCRQSHISNYNAERAALLVARAISTAAAMPSAAGKRQADDAPDDAAGAKKPRPADDPGAAP
jgi:hypothetical protein